MIYKFDYQYFGNINYYYELINSTHYELSRYDTYQKMSFRNRCTIMGANGPIDLSIPIVGGRETKVQMERVKICYKEDWQSIHLKTLISCYQRSPWFEEYYLKFQELYKEKNEYLIQWNQNCHNIIKTYLRIHSIELINKIDLKKESNQIKEDITDLTGIFLPKNPNPLMVKCKIYQQVFSDRFGFIPNLSILDLLFCEGPAASDVLMASVKSAE